MADENPSGSTPPPTGATPSLPQLPSLPSSPPPSSPPQLPPPTPSPLPAVHLPAGPPPPSGPGSGLSFVIISGPYIVRTRHTTPGKLVSVPRISPTTEERITKVVTTTTTRTTWIITTIDEWGQGHEHINQQTRTHRHEHEHREYKTVMRGWWPWEGRGWYWGQRRGRH